MKKRRILFNDNWRFTLTEPDSDGKTLENAHWYNVEIPHDWLIGDTANLYKSGCGWYEKYFTVDALGEDDCYILIFDGVYMDTTVYVNDKEVGKWKYGYTTFSFDITDALKNGENRILVRVNHKSPNTRWYSGAGIYRNVWLRKTSRRHIVENGVYISAKCSDADRREHGKWKTTVQISLSATVCGLISYTLRDPENREVYVCERRLCGKNDKLVFYMDAPKLWDTITPNLYTLSVILYDDNGNRLDDTIEKFGFRTTKFSANEGFLLNGMHLKLNGVCMHHDLGALGAAVNYDATRRQLEKLRNMGVNAIRTSHNPPSRELMELCDKMGFLVDSEIFDMWELAKNENDYHRFFPDWYKKDVEAWIKRDRNHPSVIMWSIGNEIYDTHKSPRGLEVAKMLCEEVEKNDPMHNAPPTIASNYMQWENAQNVADYLKLAGYNYTEKLYDEHHEKHPDWVIYGSETASTVRSRGIYHFPYDTGLLVYDDLQCSDLGNSVVNWGASPLRSFAMDAAAEYSMGQFVWTGFDYIGEPTPYNTKNSYFGIIDTAGFEKDSFWFYKSVWDIAEEESFIHVSPCCWDFNEGQLIDVLVYSDLPFIRLHYCGEMYEGKVIDHLTEDKLCARFTVPFHKNKPLAVRGYLSPDCDADDYEKETVLFTSLDPHSVNMTPDVSEIAADGRSLAFITVTVDDIMGQEVQNAVNRIKFTVKGAGRLVGLDNGDSTDYDSYKGNHRKLFSGKLLAIISSTFETGDIVITAESEGLKPKTITIKAVAPETEPQGVSVVTENAFPAVTTPYTNEIPVRKIELFDSEPRTLTKERDTAEISVKIFPENATFRDIEFKCCTDNGVEISFAKVVSFDGNTATLKAFGDGKFRLRAYSKNGTDIPKIISELEYTAEGLGKAEKDPYIFIAACLCDFSNVPVITIDRGSLGGFNGRTTVGFSSVDFGGGTKKITISVGNSGGGEDYPVELYLGDADNGGRYIGTFAIKNNGGWDRAYPQTFDLPCRISGTHDISFVINNSCIFGGFEFEKYDRTYAENSAADNDNLYGDDYKVNGSCVEEIGNNVVIEFNGLDFAGGTDKITVTGRTPLDNCTIQLRVNDENGGQTTRLLEFPHADEYTPVTFDIEHIAGKNNIAFVFLPGTQFDMKSFRFIKTED